MPTISPYDSNYFESNIDASDLQAVISLRNIKSLSLDSIKSLNSLGIFTVSDLIRFKPIHDAKFLLALNEGEIVHDYDFNHLTKTPGKSLTEVLNSECDELKSVSAADNSILKTSIGISSIRSLANYSAYAEALELIEKSNNIFNETPSAPHELIPRLKGTVHSLMKYTNFIREKTIKLPVSFFEYDEYTKNVADDYLKAIFIPTSNQNTEQFLKIHLGYIAEFKQKWVFINTQLGEIVHSLALAPGESRNIAIIDWKHSQTTSKTENTQAAEQLTNSFTHSRALNEITNATARENQKGTTNVEGGAIGGSLAFTSGSGTNVGAAGKGNYEGVEGAAAAGAAAGHGEGAVFSGGYSKGTITSDTNGERNITAQMSQNITDAVSQLASDVRSLWSVVVAEDAQTENRQINTRNVTNYNHSHALTVQYYEVLHRYRAEVKLNEIVPILYLPYSPLNFGIELIAKYWHLFKTYIDKDKIVKYQPVIDYYNSGKAYNAIAEYRLMQLQVKVTVKKNNSGGTLRGKLDIPGLTPSSIEGTIFNQTYVELVFQYPTTASSTLPITNFKNLVIYSEKQFADDIYVADIYIRMKFTNSSGQERMKEINVNAFPLFPDSNGTGGYNQKAEYSLDADLVASFRAEEKPTDILIGEIEQIFKSRKYFFTSLLLQSAEPQQLIDLIQGIIIKPSYDIGEVYLTDFIDFLPIGVSGNNILFKLKHFTINNNSSSSANPIGAHASSLHDNKLEAWAQALETANNQTLKSFKEIVSYFEDVKAEVMQKQKDNVSADDIYLPTSGIFAEAILGRSNASEKIDITRFYNWQDSPIPNLAPQINPVDPNSDLKKQPLDTSSNLQPQVLNYFNTPQLPDPTGMTGVMQAIQNGNMFRDMSKSETLLGVLTNLTNFSTELAKLSSTMAGDAQKSTIAAATEIAKAAVSALNGSGISGGSTGGGQSGSGLGSGSGSGTGGSQITTPSKPATTQTEKGGAINVLDNAQNDGAINEEDIGTSKVLTAGGTLVESNSGGGGLNPRNPASIIPALTMGSIDEDSNIIKVDPIVSYFGFESVYNFNKTYANSILQCMDETNTEFYIGIHGNRNSKKQLQNIALGNSFTESENVKGVLKQLTINPNIDVIKILPLLNHVATCAELEKNNNIIFGSFIRPTHGKICIDINLKLNNKYYSFSPEQITLPPISPASDPLIIYPQASALSLVIKILSYLKKLPLDERRNLKIGLPFQNPFFLPSYKDNSLFGHIPSPSSKLVIQNQNVRDLINDLGAGLFPDDDDHMHIQVFSN